jgi:alkylation response protein AidB-like acyl-CoA dehydrogenase
MIATLAAAGHEPVAENLNRSHERSGGARCTNRWAGLHAESEVERHYRDSRVLGIGGGTTVIMTEIVAKSVIA